jgi:hypothetical protein
MFTAIVSLGLIILVGAAKVVYSQTMDEMIAQSEAHPID